mmetsp:Transcript_23043/g.32469  ORF Transcript_23043/g.32469 Transcript_23043/m.32469 type:complete len:128 (-) Transcript_23043:73-456(-)
MAMLSRQLLLLLVFIFKSSVSVHAQLNRDFEPVGNSDNQDNLRRALASDQSPDNIYSNPNPTEGPWPECLGWTGVKCKDYIDGWIGAQNGRPTKSHIVSTGMFDFQRSRVWIHCDRFGNVMAPPKRG